MRVAIIGGGMAGCAAAHQFHRLGWEIDLFERGTVLGAGVRTHFKGGHPYTFGPRHFLTKNEKVFEYLDSIVPMRRLKHLFLTYLEPESDFFSYPISKAEIPRMALKLNIAEQLENLPTAEPQNLEEYWISKVGPTLYGKFIEKYSKKMWRIEDNTELDIFNWSPKGTPLKTDNSHAWSEAISAYPVALNGYNDFFDGIKRFTTIHYGESVKATDIPRTLLIDGQPEAFDAVVNTIPLDDLFNARFGALPYIGRDIQMVMLPIENALPEDVFFAYYANDEPYTRIVEYKKLTGYTSKNTLIGIETPSTNGKHYPLPMKKWKAVQDKYKAILPERFYSIGRAGSYDYQVDIDDCIEQAMRIYEELR